MTNTEEDIRDIYDMLPSAGMDDPEIRIITYDMYKLMVNQIVGKKFSENEQMVIN